MHGLRQDLRYAARTLLQRPGFTAVAVLTLALAIGANTAIFSLADALFLGSPPAREPSRLVRVYQTREETPYEQLSFPNYQYFRDNAKAFSHLAAHYPGSPMQSVVGTSSRAINGSVVTANYFQVLGLRPFLGRFFNAEEDEVPGRDAVAVISHVMWEQQFESDPRVAGKTLTLNGRLFTIVGVAPQGFDGIDLAMDATDVWIPSAMFAAGYRYCDALGDRNCRVISLLGKLRDGQTIATAQAELEVLARQLAAEYPKTNEGRGVIVSPMRGTQPADRADNARVIRILGAMVVAVLLIACANLAGLLLARGIARRREIAIRLSLGASRVRLVRQLLTESVLLSVAGGAAGLLVAFWVNELLETFYDQSYRGVRTYFSLELDPTVVIFAVALSLLTGVVFGILPALKASRSDVLPVLKDEGTAGGLRRSRLRDILVVSQVAISIVLLVGASLLVRSLASVYRGPGFAAEQIVLLRLRPSLVGQEPSRGAHFQREAVRRLEALPGVVAASPAAFPPLPDWGVETPLWLPGRSPAPGESAFEVPYNTVGPRFFETLGVPFISGRDFDDRDRRNTPKVAIVNETLARHFWPGEDAAGRVFVADSQDYQVVGVVRDAQYLRVGERPQPYYYVSYWQQDSTSNWAAESRMHVRVTGDPRAMLPLLRREIASVDPTVPISEDRPLTDRLKYAFRPVRVASTMLACVSALAVLLSAIGLYAVLAFGVSQRTREIGIRMALGAGRGHVAGMVVRRGALLAAIGTVIGLIGASMSANVLASWLYGVGPYDVITYVGVPVVLAGIALLASWLPARRAMRVEPTVALRYE